MVGHLQYDHCDAEEMDYRDLPTVNLYHGMTNMNNERVLIFCHFVLLTLPSILSAYSFHMLEPECSLSSDWKLSSLFCLPSVPYLCIAAPIPRNLQQPFGLHLSSLCGSWSVCSISPAASKAAGMDILCHLWQYSINNFFKSHFIFPNYSLCSWSVAWDLKQHCSDSKFGQLTCQVCNIWNITSDPQFPELWSRGNYFIIVDVRIC